MHRSDLRQGHIVFARVDDGCGNIKRRPVLILSEDADIAAGRPIVAVAVTTTYPDPPPSVAVELPWHRDGAASTGLRRRSAAIATWAVVVDAAAVERVVGVAPLRCVIAVRLKQRDHDR